MYEIIEDYKNANSEEEKNEIFDSFCSSIWVNKNKRRTYNKSIKFKVKNDLLESEIGQIFNAWSEVDYIGYKSMSKDTDWCSLIRQKINNLYTRYFDKEVILNKDYMNLLRTPKRLYYRWVDGGEMNVNDLTTEIDDAIKNARELRAVYQKQKIELSWSEYKNIINGFLKKTFNNCKLINEYEDKTIINKLIYDFIIEDNFYISYICTYLENEMKQWQKEKYGVRKHKKYKRCKECGKLIENTGNKKSYCSDCAKERKKKSNRKSDKKYKNKKRENRNLST